MFVVRNVVTKPFSRSPGTYSILQWARHIYITLITTQYCEKSSDKIIDIF